MRTQRKLFALILTIILVMSMIPTTVLADEAQEGTCGAEGSNVTWKLENGVLTISGNGAMMDYDSLTSMPWAQFQGEIKEVIVTEGVTTIGALALANMTNAAEITLPNTIVSIGNYAIYQWDSLESIYIPNSVQSIGVECFYDCDKLKTVAFGSDSKLETIDQKAFKQCKALISIDIPDSVTSIGAHAFWLCESLQTVYLPQNFSYTTIPTGMFLGCKNLSSIQIPENITTISNQSFSESGLEEIVIPDTVQAIGENAFSKCEKLIAVTVGKNAVYTGSAASNRSIFYDTKNVEYLYYGKSDFTDNHWFYGLLQGSSMKTLVLGENFSADNMPYGVSFTNLAGQSVIYMLGAAEIPAAAYSAEKTTLAYTNGGFFADGAAFESGALTVPIRDGFTFAGWFTKGGDGAWDTEVETPIGNTTCYAKWYCADGHEYNEGITVGNTTTYTCDKCDFIDIVTITPPEESGDTCTEHVWGEAEVTIPATCTVDGTATYTCSVCQATKKETIQATGHSFVNYVSNEDATCTEDGTETADCGKGCGVTDTRIDAGSATGHDWSDFTVVTEATLTAPGEKMRTCEVCGITEFAEIPQLTPTPITPVTPSDPATSSRDDDDDGYAVSVPSSSSIKNGSITVSPRTADKNDTVTITVKPNAGYELDTLTVTDANGKTVRLTEKADNKYTFTMPASKVSIQVSFAKITEARRFTDVPDGYWAEDEISWAAENGYINGNTATTYNPEGPVTRQQLWMILARLSGNQPADFTAAKAWAVDNGISDGTNPGTAVSRQQLVTILYRWAEKMGYSVEGTADLTAFPDHASIASYAQAPMSWSVANGIIGGTAQGTLNPTGTTTRAQCAVILYRFYTYIAG